MNDAPERIWLQDEGDYEGAYEASIGTDMGVTWSDHAVNDDDTEYLRADIAAERIEALEAENARLREAAKPFDDAARDRAAEAAEWQDADTVAVWITIGNLRSLRAALDGESADD